MGTRSRCGIPRSWRRTCRESALKRQSRLMKASWGRWKKGLADGKARRGREGMRRPQTSLFLSSFFFFFSVDPDQIRPSKFKKFVIISWDEKILPCPILHSFQVLAAPFPWTVQKGRTRRRPKTRLDQEFSGIYPDDPTLASTKQL